MNFNIVDTLLSSYPQGFEHPAINENTIMGIVDFIVSQRLILSASEGSQSKHGSHVLGSVINQLLGDPSQSFGMTELS